MGGLNYRPEKGDIVFLDFNPSLGHEQKGARPALVVSSTLLSEKTPFVWVVPISHGKYDLPLHVKLDKRTKTDGTIFVEQLTAFDYLKRPIKYLEKAPQDIIEHVLYNIEQVVRG